MYQSFEYELDQVMPAARETGLFSSLCTIQSLGNTFGPSGASLNAWTNVTGLVNIPCTAPPPSEIRIQATEVKALAEILALQLKHVLLDDYYPQITSTMRAVIDGIPYDIMGAEADSQARMTRMDVRLAKI